jgi:hypothetical protein
VVVRLDLLEMIAKMLMSTTLAADSASMMMTIPPVVLFPLKHLHVVPSPPLPDLLPLLSPQPSLPLLLVKNLHILQLHLVNPNLVVVWIY